jgi:DNA-binding transcriptional LysR family regulator
MIMGVLSTMPKSASRLKSSVTDTPLFQRKPRGMALTAAGRRLSEVAQFV